MQFYTKISFGDEVIVDCLQGIPDLLAAKADVLLTLTQIVQSGFDGSERCVSAHISDVDHHPVSSLFLVLSVQDELAADCLMPK